MKKRTIVTFCLIIIILMVINVILNIKMIWFPVVYGMLYVWFHNIFARRHPGKIFMDSIIIAFLAVILGSAFLDVSGFDFVLEEPSHLVKRLCLIYGVIVIIVAYVQNIIERKQIEESSE